MLPRNYPTQDRLKEILHYNPYTGIFTRKAGVNKGRKIKSISSNGYIYIFAFGKRRSAHRLAWLYMTGKFPDDVIDHRNRVRSDNRFINLRDCSQIENMNNNKNGTKYERLPDVCINGEFMTFNQACKLAGISYDVAYSRYKGNSGCTAEEAILITTEEVVGMKTTDQFRFKLMCHRAKIYTRNADNEC